MLIVMHERLMQEQYENADGAKANLTLILTGQQQNSATNYLCPLSYEN